MEQRHQNKYGSLPKEILIEIFKSLKPENQITTKRDLSSCLLVCKSWYFAASEFFDENIRLVMPDDMFNQLYRDLHKFPILASKISHLKLDKSTTGKEKPETLRSIINLCSNLVELQFANNDIYHYLRVLNCPETEMTKIQKIQIAAMNIASPAVRRFHLWVNYRFCSTITHLEIVDLEDNGALNNYGGLIQMLEKFPNLTHLKAKTMSDRGGTVDINLTTLLKTCPLLQQIKLYHIGNITISNDEPPINYTAVTKLKLNMRNIDIQALQHITSRFPNVNKLRLIASQVTPNDAAFTTAESSKIISDFKDYAKSMTRSNIRCSYRNELIHVDIGGSRVKFLGGQMFLDDIPEEFLQELLMMHDEWLDREEDFLAFEDDAFYEDEYERYMEEQEEQFFYEQYLADMMYQNHIDEEADMYFTGRYDVTDAELEYSDEDAERLAFEAQQDFLNAEHEELERLATQDSDHDELERLVMEEIDRYEGEHHELSDMDHENESDMSPDDEEMHAEMLSRTGGEVFNGHGLSSDFEPYDDDEEEHFRMMHELAMDDDEDRISAEESAMYVQDEVDFLPEQDFFEDQYHMDDQDHLDEEEYFDEQEHLLQQSYLDEEEHLEEQSYLDHQAYIDEQDYLDHLHEQGFAEQLDDYHEHFDDHDYFGEDDDFNNNEF